MLRKSGRMFTSHGFPYYRIFNVTICGDGNTISHCINNVTKGEEVSFNSCQSAYERMFFEGIIFDRLIMKHNIIHTSVMYMIYLSWYSSSIFHQFFLILSLFTSYPLVFSHFLAWRSTILRSLSVFSILHVLFVHLLSIQCTLKLIHPLELLSCSKKIKIEMGLKQWSAEVLLYHHTRRKEMSLHNRWGVARFSYANVQWNVIAVLIMMNPSQLNSLKMLDMTNVDHQWLF